MFYLQMNEGGNGFEKNTPNGNNEFSNPAEAAEWASTALGKILSWSPGIGANEIVSNQIAYSGEPVVRIRELGESYSRKAFG